MASEVPAGHNVPVGPSEPTETAPAAARLPLRVKLGYDGGEWANSVVRTLFYALFLSGFNYRAVVAFLAGAGFGILAVNTTLYVGPLANVAGGVDVSFAGAALLAATLYLVLRAVFPERLGGLPAIPAPGAHAEDNA